MKTSLPEDSGERKDIPMDSGCLEYFPAALAGVAKHSKLGNDKHNPGQPLHHSRGKSSDHGDCVVRHKMDISAMAKKLRSQVAGLRDPKEVEALLTEANALSWRSLALSQEIHEEFGGAPLAPGAIIPEATASASDGPERQFKIGAKVRVFEMGTSGHEIVGTIVSINSEGMFFTISRDDGQGWADRDLGTDSYWICGSRNPVFYV